MNPEDRSEQQLFNPLIPIFVLGWPQYSLTLKLLVSTSYSSHASSANSKSAVSLISLISPIFLSFARILPAEILVVWAKCYHKIPNSLLITITLINQWLLFANQYSIQKLILQEIYLTWSREWFISALPFSNLKILGEILFFQRIFNTIIISILDREKIWPCKQ